MSGGQVAAIMAGLDKFSEKKIIQLSSEITANLQEDTPVDLGWARANWIPSVGTPYVTSPITSPAKADVSVSVARSSAGVSQIATYSIADGPIFVTNNVPYIRLLDQGSSNQAPSGFVKSAVTRALRTVS